MSARNPGRSGTLNKKAGKKSPRQAQRPEVESSVPLSPMAQTLLLWGAFFLIGLFVYGPALDGAFLSDDFHYVATNEYVHTPNVSNLIAIWNPQSEVTVLVENYAPVHLMLHSLEWQFFGSSVQGYHVVNILLHALAAAMLVSVYRRSRIGVWAAAAGAAFFFLHPANVESVAWISQIKSASALVLSLGALLLHARHPAPALLLFALALLAKPFAAFALIVVVLFTWVRAAPNRDEGVAKAPAFPAHWGWLGAWLAVVLLYASVESSAFSESAAMTPPLYSDVWVRVLMIFSVALRYSWMSLSGRGLSTFHEPLPVSGLADPFLIGGVLVVLLLGLWTGWALLKRREEGVYLMWAAVSLAPLSGVIPLPYPMADRYLYFILPGLIGAFLLGGARWSRGLADRWELDLEKRKRIRAGAMVVLGLVLIHAGQLTYDRAHVFVSPESLMSDAERNYPEGVASSTRRATRAAQQGRFDDAVRFLQVARVRGYNRVDNLLQDPSFGPMQNHPDFVAIKHEMADDWIDRLSKKEDISHYTARALAQAYIVKGRYADAAEVLEGAASRPGPIGDALQQDAQDVRGEIAFRNRLKAAERARKSNAP